MLRRMKDAGFPTVPIEDGEDRKGVLGEIDPFTFFANFNRGITDLNRQAMWEIAKSELNLSSLIILYPTLEGPHLRQ